mmetsp:Transcript_39184/g.117807  ORF Transcript_39184/g.117807 Transcript_39184/m.117807 type:complete len:131 (-) Transcript_39184:268-660(-)
MKASTVSSRVWIGVTLLLASVVLTASAFQIPPRVNQPPSLPTEVTELRSSRALDEGENIMAQASVVPQRKDVSWVDLPKSAESSDEDVLPSAEIIIGRIAMVGALGLFANEVISGKSVMEQFIDLYGMMH